MTRRFYTATDEEILEARTTDVYFQRTRSILDATHHADTPVVAEVTASSLPRDWPWAVLSGLEEATNLLEDHPLDLWTLPEGTIFRSRAANGPLLPVAVIQGPYGAFCELETPLLGLLCQASGVSTAAARVRRAAGDAPVLSFGVRRMHPAIAPAIDRAAIVGGVDGVSSVRSAEMLDLEPQGTMPHALVIVLGDHATAWQAFHEHVHPDVPRTALVDTTMDEVREALLAAETLGEDLDAVRIDTTSSRRGDLPHIVREVRWELDLRGWEDVDILVSGGLTEETIPPLLEAGADGFGVGTSLSNAPTVNYALDIVEVDGEPRGKRGKFSGRKHVLRCPACSTDLALPWSEREPEAACPACGDDTEPLLERVLERGEPTGAVSTAREARSRLLAQLDGIPASDASSSP